MYWKQHKCRLFEGNRNVVIKDGKYIIYWIFVPLTTAQPSGQSSLLHHDFLSENKISSCCGNPLTWLDQDVDIKRSKAVCVFIDWTRALWFSTTKAFREPQRLAGSSIAIHLRRFVQEKSCGNQFVSRYIFMFNSLKLNVFPWTCVLLFVDHIKTIFSLFPVADYFQK